ncbi:MAG: PepSY domain-containing protein [Clostridia bacterium]|nr:PepSY domain-containing protein [Clostridia bacterium]
MKKIIAFTLCLVFALSLTACGRTMEGVKDDTQSIVSDTESIVSDASSAIKDNDKKTNLMAGITANDALESALKHAGFQKSQVNDIDIDLDRDNGKLIYEVDFNIGDTEYDYDIDADTGAVISADKSKD